MKMTNEEVMVALRDDESPLNRARREFSNWRRRIDQESSQRQPLAPIDMRRMEFEAIKKIAEVLGVRL